MVGWDKGVALLVMLMMWLRVRKERRERGGTGLLGFPSPPQKKPRSLERGQG